MKKIEKLVYWIKKALVKLLQTKFIRILILGSMNLLSNVVNRDSRIVLCGAINGRWYGDNSRYVYEWMLLNRSDLKPIWLTNNIKIFSELREQNKPVVIIGSLKGVFYLLKANVAVFTNSLYDIAQSPFLIPNSMNLIALRHGRSVKRIRFARKAHKISPLEQIERLRESMLVRYVISTSDFISDIQEECLKIGRDKHIVTGYPRNDLLNRPEAYEVEAWESFIADLKDKKVVLYAPSWRHGRNYTKFFPFDDFSIEKLSKFLAQKDIVLLLRPHANDLIKYPELVEFLTDIENASENIKLATHHIFPDANSLLPFSDVLISDYSAIYHDYLLLNRPLLFIPYDQSEFEHLNGFLYDYEKLMPGPSVLTQNELILQLEMIVSGNDMYSERRKTLCDLVHKYQDNNARERVSILIDELRRHN